MKEQLITFETAKLAKQKGLCDYFETTSNNTEYVPAFYSEDGDTFEEVEFQLEDCVILDRYFRPTQSLLQKWLREVHGINIFMTFKPNIKKWDFIPYLMNMNAKEYIEYNSNYTKQNNERRFDTYEEALEIGLQEALKLIQK